MWPGMGRVHMLVLTRPPCVSGVHGSAALLQFVKHLLSTYPLPGPAPGPQGTRWTAKGASLCCADWRGTLIPQTRGASPKRCGCPEWGEVAR